MSQSEKLSGFEERISLYYQEEGKRMPAPQGFTQRIVEKATSLAAEKPTRRHGFRLLAGGAMAAVATAALLVAALVMWNVQQGTASVSAQEILQRVEETYQKGQPSEDIPVVGFSFGWTGPGETNEVTLVLTSTELAEVLPELRENFGATVVGEETVEGRGQYVLTLVPKGEGALPAGVDDVLPPGAEIQLWVDKETNLIRQMAVSMESANGERVEGTWAESGPHQAEMDLWPGFSLTVEEGTTYASLLEDLSERYDVTVTSEETLGSATHYVLSLVPKAGQEGLSPATADVWVDAESGKVTRMSWASNQGAGEVNFGPE